jgi:hypothetical protein
MTAVPGDRRRSGSARRTVHVGGKRPMLLLSTDPSQALFGPRAPPATGDSSRPDQSDRFIGAIEPAFGEKILNVAIAQKATLLQQLESSRTAGV